MIITSLIRFLIVFSAGTAVFLQEAAIQHLAAVRMKDINFLVGRTIFGMGAANRKVSGSIGTSRSVTSFIRIWTLVQYFTISGQVHQMWTMSPLLPQPLQHWSEARG
ncbi:hypothetical protein FKM82_026517 [Ascaphus truei]